MINEVLDQLMYLRLKSAYTFLKELHINDGISQNELKGLYKVLKKEVEAKEENNRLYNVKVAGFPFLRTVDDYDFEFQPSVSKEKIFSIVESNFYEEATNIVFVGNPGTGKTHLAIAIAYAVAIKRNCVYFIKFNKLISILKNAYNEGTFDRKVKQFFKYKLLIIDEVGFLPIDKQGANMLFQLINKRYEKTTTSITTNQPFSKWSEIFGDAVLANAILDRLLHHSHVFVINGKSYRTKDILELKEELSET